MIKRKIKDNDIIICSICKSIDIEDHNEFGLPLWFRYRCRSCGSLFRTLTIEPYKDKE